jgi:hypothetical protein
MGFNAEKKKTLDSLLHTQGYTDQKMDRYAFLMVH